MSTSTYCFITQLRKVIGLVTRAVIPVLSVLSGLLIALQMVLSPAAYAASSVANSYTFGTNQPLDQASVSVVRLVAAYAAPSVTVPPAPPATCASTLNGLGVFVGSWPTTAGGSDIINTVMTDGSLVNPDGISCGTGKPNATLSTIQIYVNEAYTNSNPATALLKTLQCRPAQPAISCTDGTTSASLVCQDSAPCSNGVVLISFHTTSPQPFIDMAAADQTTPAPFGVGLAGPTSLTGATPSATQATQLLTPIAVTNTGDPKNDLGMPIVNEFGQLLDMNTKATDTGGTIRSYVNTQLTPLQNGHTNSLHDSWNSGIADYYKSDFTDAQTAFRNAGTHNSVFRAGVAFWTLATSKANSNSLGRNGKTPTTGRTGTPATGVNVLGVTISDSILTLLLAGLLVLLVILLALITFGIVRRQMRQRREFAKLNRRAEADAAQIAQQEKEDQLRAQQVREQSPVNVNSRARMGSTAQSAQPLPPVLGQASQVPPPQAVPDLRCPNCGIPVNRTDNFCPQCHSPLVLSDSGLNVRLGKKPTSAPLSAASPPPAALPPAPPPPPPPGLVPSVAFSDMPTEELPLGGAQNGSEATQPRAVRESVPRSAPPVEQFTGRKLGLVVGTRSDPGIKRQHKPNEDSVFAAEGMLNSNTQAPQFGLFVVADGMGGHANGQDASRLAIQTIVETLMPRLTGNESFNDDFAQLLAEGVQKANVAVHQRNIDHHADMGTTMTATLVVGNTAYIANVGDSRTYLYRQPDGLKKITHDHSVVASLVEAGIIKPDDVYTHSQRNQIYRSLGEKPVVDVDTFKVPLQPGDKIILCSDGLWEMVRDPTIEQLLNTVPDPSQTRNALIQAALEGGGEDNVSVIVVHVADSPQGNGFSGVQILAKPDEPQYPPM